MYYFIRQMNGKFQIYFIRREVEVVEDLRKNFRRLVIGSRAIFTTTQSNLTYLNGNEVTVLRELEEAECDIDDVGYMYEVKFFDGTIKQAFADELF